MKYFKGAKSTYHANIEQSENEGTTNNVISSISRNDSLHWNKNVFEKKNIVTKAHESFQKALQKLFSAQLLNAIGFDNRFMYDSI